MNKRSRFEPHSHSHLSNIRLRDAISTVPGLINRAIDIGLKGIAITEHECLSSAVSANQIQEKLIKEGSDFKVVLGNEIYLVDERIKGQKYYHFILMAKNKTGFRALRELSSNSWLNSYHDHMERVPTLKSELENILKKYPNSLIGTSSCLGRRALDANKRIN